VPDRRRSTTSAGVSIRTAGPAAGGRHAVSRATGSFLLIDPPTGQHAAAGLVGTPGSCCWSEDWMAPLSPLGGPRPGRGGARQPGSTLAATISALVDEVRRQRPDLDVRLSFLDLSTPRLSDVLAAVAADGHRDAVVAPLLLGNAFHARVDVPGVVARASRRYPRLRLSVARVLGGDPRLAGAALGRLTRAAGPLDDPELGVVLAATGSSRASANDAVHQLASSWAVALPVAGMPGRVCHDVSPSVPEAITRLRAAGAARIRRGQLVPRPRPTPRRVHTAALSHRPGRHHRRPPRPRPLSSRPHPRPLPSPPPTPPPSAPPGNRARPIAQPPAKPLVRPREWYWSLWRPIPLTGLDLAKTDCQERSWLV